MFGREKKPKVFWTEGSHNWSLLWQLQLFIFTWKGEYCMEVVVTFLFWAWFWDMIWRKLAKPNTSTWHWKWIRRTMGHIFLSTPSCSLSFPLLFYLEFTLKKIRSSQDLLPLNSNPTVFSDPFETCVIGKPNERKGKAYWTVICDKWHWRTKNQLLSRALFFLEVATEKHDFWAVHNAVLNFSYAEMHHRELHSVCLVSNP